MATRRILSDCSRRHLCEQSIKARIQQNLEIGVQLTRTQDLPFFARSDRDPREMSLEERWKRLLTSVSDLIEGEEEEEEMLTSCTHCKRFVDSRMG